MRRSNSTLLAALLAICTISNVFAGNELKPVKITVDPAEVSLIDIDQSVQLLVTVEMSDGSSRDITTAARYSLDSKDAFVTIDKGWLAPKKNGAARLIIIYETSDRQNIGKTIPVTVKLQGNERTLNFANDVVPIMTKAGCNSGGCHGKSLGQNGFSLSLLGFEPDYDFDALVTQGRGRRVFPGDPEQSLILKKASGTVAHGGGKRLAPDSREYTMLRRWIEQGMPKGKDSDPKVDKIEVMPRERILVGSKDQQLRVVAIFTDGTRHDVTRQAEYKSQEPDILKVEPTGAVSTLDRTGEGAVMVRYMGIVDVAKITVPFNRSVPENAYAGFTPRGYVDELMLAKWRKLGIAPSPACSDDVFIRRAFLDAIGTLPKPDEVLQFVSDASPDKRDKLIDKILERPEYADFWANQWGDLLRNKREGDEQKRGTFAFASWIRNCFAENMPYDQFVREILTAQGEVGDNPAVNWYRHVRNQIHLVNDTSQIFLGTRVACANCHHHPYEKLSQDDYWGFAAFFQRVGKKAGDVPADQAVFLMKNGDTFQPRSGKKMTPKALAGPEYDYVAGVDPRKNLADWMTAPGNPYFAKAIANRMFGHIMGIGLVNAIDDMRITNPPSNPALLDALASDLIEHKFDLKHLIRTIMRSQTYSLSSNPTEYNAKDQQNYARYHTRRLSAEVLMDAISEVTGSPEKYPGLPLGTRAIELPDQAVGSYFLQVFGRSGRETPCECERSYSPNLAQILHLMNSPELQNKIADPKGTVNDFVNKKTSNAETIEALYLKAFARKPRTEEMTEAVSLLAAAKDHKPAVEDFAWMLLNSKEFLFNH